MHLERMSAVPSEYVVLDVETNGLKAKEHDLLSIALYKPDDGKVYERYLPLEMNSSIPKRISKINGIWKSHLRGKKPLSQAEVDELFDTFELDRRTILHYGALDERFIRHYFERHHLEGFERLKFFNFKKLICSSSFSDGSITKDNLCGMFDIDGVTEVHSAANDCVLEWKLFDAIGGRHLLVTRAGLRFNSVFALNEDYVVPVSYLANRPNLSALYERPYIICESELIARLDIDRESIRKFPSNVTGVTVEHLISTLCNAKRADGIEWMRANKSKLELLGWIPTYGRAIPVRFMSDGAVEAVYKVDEAKVREVNEFNGLLRKKIEPFVKHAILNDIFDDAEEILSQELVVHEDIGILALCDLSSKNAVLEIKTFDANPADVAEQLYYEANGRDTYLLSIKWGEKGLTESHAGAQLLLYHVNPHPGDKPNKRTEKAAEKLRLALEPQGIELVKYRGSHEKALLRCPACGCEWAATIYKVANGRTKCPTCFPKKTNVRKPRATSLERGTQLASKVSAASDGIIEIDPTEYKTMKVKVVAHCLKCDHRWLIRGDHLLEKPVCPKCKQGRN